MLNILLTCMSIPQTCLVFCVEKKKDISFPGTGVTNSSELPCGFSVINSSLQCLKSGLIYFSLVFDVMRKLQERKEKYGQILLSL